MGLDLTESAIDEFYGMIGDIAQYTKDISGTLEDVAISLDRIADALEENTSIKGGEA